MDGDGEPMKDQSNESEQNTVTAMSSSGAGAGWVGPRRVGE